MKIAVTYDESNGTIWQHFGRTEAFKLYEVQDNEVKSSEVLSSGGTGHEALAGLLADNSIEAVICGGLGMGMMNALQSAGIEVISGQTGGADEAVAKYLKGELESGGVNCDHHDHEHHHEDGAGCGGNCHNADSENCDGDCDSCASVDEADMIDGKNAGKTVSVHYRGTFNDGTEFDSSYSRNEPLTFVCGAGMMIKGFDKAVVDMEVGDSVDIHLMPEDAYGMPDPDAIVTVPTAQLPGSENLAVGAQVYLRNAYGQPFPARVTDKTDDTITFDCNHEMAGKELNFHIELLSVK